MIWDMMSRVLSLLWMSRRACPYAEVDHETLAEYNLYTELRCELSSPVLPALLNGRWHGPGLLY